MSIDAILNTIIIALVFTILGYGVFLSFKILNITDLTVEASFALGASITGMMCNYQISQMPNSIITPIISLVVSFIGGSVAGTITAILHTKLKINSVLSGILVLTAFYTINLLVIKKDSRVYSSIGLSDGRGVTLFSPIGYNPYLMALIMFGIVILIGALIFLFFKTKLGLSIRSCGDNEEMTKTQGISTDNMKIIGLALANGLVSFSGSLFVMAQHSFSTGIEKGMMVVGVATIIIGEILVRRSHNLGIMLIGIMLGSIIYRFIYAFALRLDFIETTYLHLITAGLIVLIMFLSNVIQKRSEKNKLIKIINNLNKEVLND